MASPASADATHSLAIGGQHPFARDPQSAAQQAALYRQGGMAGVIADYERVAGPVPSARGARLLAEDAEALAAVVEAMGTVPSLEAQLPGLTLPTLVYCGEQDPGHAAAQRAVTLMPQAAFVPLPGLNHAEAWRRSDLVIPHLRALHARVAGAAVSGTS